MNQAAAGLRRPFVIVGLFVLGSIVFSIAYCQAPLYYSNQNQYFVHGLAEAGDGVLAEDWLARTADPTPIFTGLVGITAHALHSWVFHIYHALLLGAYGASLLGIFWFVVGAEVAARRWPVFLALIVAIHSALGRWASYRFLGLDYPWYFQAGVAGQYILGAMFQPSAFGVLLVVAVSLFVHGRSTLAVVCIAAAATIHPTYLMSGALLTAGFLAAKVRADGIGSAVKLASLALLMVLPTVAFVVLQFRPTSPEMFAEANDILVNVRIPHHSRPGLWLDPIAALQLGWIIFALILVRRTPLVVVLAVPFVLSSLLTLAQVVTASDALALLFPWRISSILVPLATAIVTSRLLGIERLPLNGKAILAAGIIGGLVLAGGWINFAGLAFRGVDEEAALVDFVRRTRSSGDVYLLPVRIPQLATTTRGSLSSDFKPLPDKRADARIIPVDLQRFRLATGTPIYVDFKAIPYRDNEVIEWRRRLADAERWQQWLRENRTDDAVKEMWKQGVTHVAQPTAKGVDAPGLIKVHEDQAYVVYRLSKPPEPDAK